MRQHRLQASGERRRGASAAASVLLAALAVAHPAGGAPYRIDHARSELVVRVFKAGPASVLAHDHVVRAARWTGTLDVNRDPVALAADLQIEVAALEVDDPALRARYHLDGSLSEDDRAEVRESMLGPAQLDAAHHPEIRFLASEIDRAGSDFRLAGQLTLHGETRRVVLPIAVTESGAELTARGTLRLKQSDFGITPYSAFLGAVRNQDEIELVATIVASPAERR